MKNSNKTVLITGASSGFGKAATKLFAANGWNVIATMRSPEKEEELTSLDHVLVTKLDVQQPETIQNAVTAGIEKFGKIDALVNNAGYGAVGIFESASSEQIKTQFDVNVFGLMDVTQAVLPHLRTNGAGTIINISSMGGRITFPTLSLYHATKFAVEGFSEALSYELASLNIAVKLIEPGSVETNFFHAVDFISNTIPEYDAVVKTFTGRYGKPTAHLQKATADDVARVIYEATTDGKSQLRYLVGGDAEFYIDGKQKNSDQDYVNLMRDYFINE
jgi:NAD(P)-dependent dehydrogenase (short-subunit alcohol dehydrogenase family)